MERRQSHHKLHSRCRRLQHRLLSIRHAVDVSMYGPSIHHITLTLPSSSHVPLADHTLVRSGGGMGISTNRTYWPIYGGAVAFQPGWFSGHSSAFIYVNLGLGSIPPNYSHTVVPVFEVLGPSNDPWPGLDMCLPQVPLPANVSINPGDNATIQVVEAAKHGAALFSVSREWCRGRL